MWRTCRDEQGDLLPYTYDVTFCGTDQDGAEMRLDLHVTPSRAPVPLGAAAYNGVIECFGQATHVFLLPDRHDDDRNAVVGFGRGDGDRNDAGTSTGSGFRWWPTTVAGPATSAPAPTSGARSTWTTAST